MLELKNITYLVFALSHITQKTIQKEQCHSISSIAYARNGFKYIFKSVILTLGYLPPGIVSFYI